MYIMFFRPNYSEFSRIPDAMPFRALPPATIQGWRDLASVFDKLLGGTEMSQRAATYLRNLANGTLPENELLPLPWHESEAQPEVMVAVSAPHPCVLAVLCPSVPLRAVWRRGR